MGRAEGCAHWLIFGIVLSPILADYSKRIKKHKNLYRNITNTFGVLV